MTLTAATLGARRTLPGILVQLGDSLRLSSRASLSVLGFDWTAAGIRLTAIGSDGTGRQTLSLSLADPDSDWVPLILAGLAADMACNLWLTYRAADGTLETQLEFAGVIASASLSTGAEGSAVDIEAVGEGPSVSWTPRIPWRSAFAVRRGAQVTINDETFVLE